MVATLAPDFLKFTTKNQIIKQTSKQAISVHISIEVTDYNKYYKVSKWGLNQSETEKGE